MRRLLALAALLAAAAAPADAATYSVRGIIDVTATGRGDGFAANTLTHGDNPFDAYGARMFVESSVNAQFSVFGEAVLHDVSGVYVNGAYVTWKPGASSFHVIAGKVPWMIGTYGPRSNSDKNPLIGKPLMYQYHTTLVWYALPPSADALLASRGTGQSGIGYLGGNGFGMPVVDDSYWDVGVVASGSLRMLEYSLGVTNGTPGWANTSQDDNRGKSTLGRIGLSPAPWMRLGVSGSRGPYLIQDLSKPLPAGKSPEDYQQQMVMGDLELTQGHAELHAEAVANTWQSPYLGNLDADGGYVEGKLTLMAGLWAAARWDVLRFSDITDSSGARQPWEFGQDRLETGLGLRYDRNVYLKGVFQRNFQHQPAGDQLADLYALQMTVVF